MAVAVALSPWPRLTSEIDRAVECLRQVLPDSLDDARIKRLGAVAAAHVERYASNAPQNVKDQSAEMYIGYMAESRGGPVTKISLRTIDIERQVNHAAMFRNCGAAGLLSPWKKRRGGAIPGTYKETEKMSRTQLPNVDITETAINIADGLDSDTSYEFQRSIESQIEAVILYAFGGGDTAPANDADYHVLDGFEYVAFIGSDTVWCKVADTTSDRTAAVAISTT